MFATTNVLLDLHGSHKIVATSYLNEQIWFQLTTPMTIQYFFFTK